MTVDGRFRVVSVETKFVHLLNDPMGQLTSAVVTTLVPATTSSLNASCTIQALDDYPKVNVSPTGGRSASGYSQITVSSGCSTVSWSHSIYTYTFRQGALTWVKRGTTYSSSVAAGREDYDIRSSGCAGSNMTTWKNDSNYTNGQTADIACYLS